MFTGIVEEAGVVEQIRETARSIRLTVGAAVCGKGIKTGDSLAVNGCCLTVVQAGPGGRRRRLQFDLLRETWDKTNFCQAGIGSLVNLERPLRAEGRLDGHFVTGHVDGTGRITRWEKAGADWVLELALPPEVQRYMVYKGSIAVDGISLTVADVLPKGCRIWIIPHTYEVTALRQRQRGDLVNLEADILGKYVDRFFSQMSLRQRRRPAASWRTPKRSGGDWDPRG